VTLQRTLANSRWACLVKMRLCWSTDGPKILCGKDRKGQCIPVHPSPFLHRRVTGHLAREATRASARSHPITPHRPPQPSPTPPLQRRIQGAKRPRHACAASPGTAETPVPNARYRPKRPHFQGRRFRPKSRFQNNLPSPPNRCHVICFRPFRPRSAEAQTAAIAHQHTSSSGHPRPFPDGAHSAPHPRAHSQPLRTASSMPIPPNPQPAPPTHTAYPVPTPPRKRPRSEATGHARAHSASLSLRPHLTPTHTQPPSNNTSNQPRRVYTHISEHLRTLTVSQAENTPKSRCAKGSPKLRTFPRLRTLPSPRPQEASARQHPHRTLLLRPRPAHLLGRRTSLGAIEKRRRLFSTLARLLRSGLIQPGPKMVQDQGLPKNEQVKDRPKRACEKKYL